MPKLHFMAILFLLWSACPAPAQPPEQGATIRATAAEVLLDVVVRDKKGKLVKNLKPGDIEVYEDGVKQEVKSFRYVAGREGRQQVTKSTSTSKQIAAPVAAGPRPLRAVNLVCLVMHNLDPVSRQKAMEALQEYLSMDQPPDTLVAAFALDDRLVPLHAFTSDRNEILQAARTGFPPRPLDFTGAAEAVYSANPTRYVVTANVTAAGPASTANVTGELRGGEMDRSTIAGADLNTATGANAQRGDKVSERRDFSNISGMREADKINTMLELLGSLPGRKTILLASTGLITTGEPERMESLISKANKTGITVYPLDVTGLQMNSSSKGGDVALGRAATISGSQTQRSQPGMGELGAMKEKSRQGDNIEQAVRASDAQAGLRALAEGTGGFLIANTNEFRKPFQRITEEMEAHYETAYQPPSGRLDGRLRRVEVKARRADLSVESRKGYFALPELKGGPLSAGESLGLAVLSAQDQPRQFEFGRAVFQFGGSRQALAFEVPGAALTATPRVGRGLQAMHATVVALVKDASGQVVDKYSVDAPYELPDANLAAVRNSSMSYSHPLSLGPGKYTVESVVMDREGQRSSVAVFPLEIAEQKPSVGISSALLVQRVEPAQGTPDAADPLLFQGQRIVPFLAPAVPAGATPMAYFVVYPNKANAAKPRIDVEFLVDGKSLAKQSAELPNPDAAGAIPMVIRAATRPGRCELRITAVQGEESSARSVSYQVAAR